jgi:hypothetical protein
VSGVNFTTNFGVRQSRVALTQITFDAFNGNSIWQKYTKIWFPAKKAVAYIIQEYFSRNVGKHEHLLRNFYGIFAQIRWLVKLMPVVSMTIVKFDESYSICL